MAKKDYKEHTTKKKEKPKREYPIDIQGGYYARNEMDYKFDKMLREYAKKKGKDAMYDHIRSQMDRNSLRRIEDCLDYILDRIMAIEDILNHKA